MNDVSPELKNLLREYQGDTYRILKEHPQLDYLYALSDMRENLLEWFDFEENASLLQVGSDYGALTGLFARRVGQVTVLDDEGANLEVNRMRHGAAENVSYVPGSLMDYTGNGFDYVVMVGSLRAAGASAHGSAGASAHGSVAASPHDCSCQAQIDKAKSLLKPGGKLILAVCNRLGLKYQAGAKPDSVRLSRVETAELFGHGGTLEFYYPMPDYRLPLTIYSDSYLPAKGDLTHAILAYDYPKYLRFDLGRMYDEVCEGKQFETFANSFLTIWSSHEED